MNEETARTGIRVREAEKAHSIRTFSPGWGAKKKGPNCIQIRVLLCERLPKRYISKVKLPKRYTFRLPLSMRLRQSDTIPFLRRVHLRVPPGNAGIPRLPYPKTRRSNSPSAS